jgi:hypothetical protein
LLFWIGFSLYFVQGVLLFFGGRTGLLSWYSLRFDCWLRFSPLFFSLVLHLLYRASFLDFNLFQVNNSNKPLCIAPLDGLQQLMMGFVFPVVALVQLWITFALREALYMMIGRREKMRRTEILGQALELTQTSPKGAAGSKKAEAEERRPMSPSMHSRAKDAVRTTQHAGCIESMFGTCFISSVSISIYISLFLSHVSFSCLQTRKTTTRTFARPSLCFCSLTTLWSILSSSFWPALM